MRTLIALSALLTLAACEPEEVQRLDGTLLDAACQEQDSRDGDSGLDGSIAVSTSGSTITVNLIGVEANCCPTPAVEVSNDAETISVNFIDVTNEDEVCDCVCPTDFGAEIEDVEAGSYTVEVLFLDVLVDSAEVEVE